ncbi:MAG: hypothetical protein V4676_01990 [Bacteroidota bacterium]
MKKTILFLLLAVSFTANAQSLKDLLYGGKLKNDSNTVIRKTDDLSTKIDTGTRKPTETAKPKDATVNVGAEKQNKAVGVTDSATVETEDAAEATKEVVEKPAAPVKSNNKIWKEYTDALLLEMKTDVLSSKKVKKESYYLTVDYELATDGAVSIINVTCSPENEFLQQQVKERIIANPPVLAAYIDSSKQPRKVKRKYNFSVTKE